MTRWIRLTAALLTAACLCCASAARSGTGIEGRIMKGPMCPGPVRIGRPCPNQPAVGSFLLVDAAGREAASFRTDAEGRFRVPARPGTYSVVPVQGNGRPFLMGRRGVVVPAKTWIRVELTFDTGMR